MQVASPAGPPPGNVAANPSHSNGAVLLEFSVPSGGSAAKAEVDKAKTKLAAARIGEKRSVIFFMATFLSSAFWEAIGFREQMAKAVGPSPFVSS